MIPIPEGAESYSEESTRSSSYGSSQETLDQPGDVLMGSGHPRSAEGADGERKRREPEGLCSLAGPDMEAVLHGM